MNIDHIGLETADLYTLELFYRKYFGFMPAYRHVSLNQPGLRTVMLEKDSLRIELLERPQNPAAATRRLHFSLAPDSVAAEHGRLSALGLRALTTPRRTGDGYLEFTVTDPDGNLIEIAERAHPAPEFPVRAVIFDLDGTVIDSEDNYFEADKKLMQSYGIPFTQDMKKEFVGTGNLEMIRRMKVRYKIPDSPEIMLEKKNRCYMEIARQNTPVFPEMRLLLDWLLQNKIPMAIASGSSPAILEELLDLTGIRRYFAHVVSAEDVPRGKPAPDVFVETARRLEVDCRSCVVFEDSQYGVEAACRAFMRTVAIPYFTDKPLPDAFFMADLLFENGMAQFRAQEVIEWIKIRIPSLDV